METERNAAAVTAAKRRRLAFWGVAVLTVVVLGGWIAYENIGTTRFMSDPVSDISAASVAGDWPMFQRDPSHAGSGSSDALLTGNLRWQYETGRTILSSPAVADGRVYLTVDGKVIALDGDSGDVLWEYDVLGPMESSPAVAGDFVYFGLKDGRVVALDKITGELEWDFRTEGGVVSSPAVYRGVVYFGSNDQRIYALDAVTGKERWSHLTNGRVTSDPAVNDDVVAVSSLDGYLYIIDIDTGNRRLDYVFSYDPVSPTFNGDAVYVADTRGYVTAIDWQQREKPFEKAARRARFHFYVWGWVDIFPQQKGMMWRLRERGDGFVGTPVVVGDSLYVGSKAGTVFSIDRTTGAVLWTFGTNASIRTSPSIAGQTLYVGDVSGRLYALDAPTGEELWQYKVDGPIVSTPVIANDSIYLASKNGILYAIQ